MIHPPASANAAAGIFSMILVTSHQSIVAVLASSPATQPDFSSSCDVYSGATRTGAVSKSGTLSSTTEVQVVENPSGSEHRRVDSLAISNRHNAGVVCTVSFKDGADRRVLVECEIGVDETLEWDGSQWSIFPEIASGSGTGDVVGPAIGTATDNAFSRFDGTSGKLIQNSVVIATDGGNVSGIVDLAATGNATVGGTLGVTGLTTVANLTCTGTWTYNALAAKGDLIAATADNTPGILTVGSDYHTLQASSAQATGLQWSRRPIVWHSEIADAAAHHTSSSESAALYSATAIPTALINVQRTTIRVRAWGKASTTSAPTLTLRIKLNDTSISQAVGTPLTASPGSGVTDRSVFVEGIFVVRSTGSSGTIEGNQAGLNGTAGANGARGLITLNLTNSITVELTAQWSASSASNTFTATGFTVEIMN